ncbi:MAG: hypothetical protein FJY88_09555, partial [Candidatus Eisenbacteria bacterium]|nr:hypothetical protein [Candidatus Eisenbacteria bacterium]
ILVFDVSDPMRPEVVRSLRLDWAWAVSVDGDRLYARALGDLSTYGIENPAQPILLGSHPVGYMYVPPLEARGDVVAVGQAGSVDLLDAGDPENVTVLASVPIEGQVRGLDWHPPYLFAGGSTEVLILDTTDLQSPVRIASIRLAAEVRGIAVADTLLFVARTDSLVAYSIHEIESPRFCAASRISPVLPQPVGFAVRGDRLYFCGASHRETRCYDISPPCRLEELCRYSGAFSQWHPQTSLVLVDDVLLAGGWGGLRSFDLDSGECLPEPAVYPLPDNARGIGVLGNRAFVASDYRFLEFEVGADHTPRAVADVYPDGYLGYVIDVTAGWGVTGASEVRTFDLSATGNPVPIGSVACESDSHIEVFDPARRMVAACGGPSFIVVDASNPEEPFIVEELPLPEYETSVATVYEAPFIYGISTVSLGLVEYVPGQAPIPRPLSWVDTPTEPRGLAVRNRHAYVADDNCALYIYDYTDPDNPQLVNQIMTDVCIDNPDAIQITGDQLLLCGFGLSIYSLADPVNPVRSCGLEGGIHYRGWWQGDLLYTIYMAHGVSVYRTSCGVPATPPVVLQTEPTNGAGGVGMASVLTVQFSEEIARETLDGSSWLVTGSRSGRHAGTITWLDASGTKARFDPAEDFSCMEAVSCVITDAVTDLDGNHLDGDGNGVSGGDWSWGFSTGGGQRREFSPNIPSRRYFLFSLPSAVEGGALSSLLSEMGTPGTVNWAAYGYEEGALVKNPVGEIGRGYWLCTARESRPGVVGCEFPDTVTVGLEAGWNILGWPAGFSSPPPWDSCAVVRGSDLIPFGTPTGPVRPVIHWYDDPSGDLVNNGAWKSLGPEEWASDGNPWGGYFVFATEPCTFRFAPRVNAKAQHESGPMSDVRNGSSRSTGSVRRDLGAGGVAAPAWSFTFSACGGPASDGGVVVGARAGAGSGYDRYDVEKPPMVDGGVRLAIVHVDRSWAEYLRDYVGDDAESAQWELRVTGDAEWASLAWSGSGSLSPEQYLYLIDPVARRAVDLRRGDRYEFLLPAAGRDFQVLLSREPWHGALFEPVETGFEALGPNPTRGPMTIRFGVGKPGPARVDLFDVQGRRVGELWRSIVDPGVYEIGWNARECTISPGVYFVRVQATSGADARSIQVVR